MRIQQKNILKPDSLEPAAVKKVCHAFKREIQRTRQTKGGLSGFVCNAWCESVASCYDPHTEYFSPGKKEEFQGELGDKPLQFGFSLGEGKDAVEITRLKPGSPAYKSGMIHEGDQILALQWENDEEMDVSDGSVEEVNSFISGDHGKSLTLTLKKTDGTTRKVTLQREKSFWTTTIARFAVLSCVEAGTSVLSHCLLFILIGTEKKAVIMVVQMMLPKKSSN